MKKTHILKVKGKIINSIDEEQAKILFAKLISSEIKIKIFDTEKSCFIFPYITDVSLELLDEFSVVIENSDLTRKRKNIIYRIIEEREKERQRINEKIIQNIIDNCLEFDR